MLTQLNIIKRVGKEFTSNLVVINQKYYKPLLYQNARGFHSSFTAYYANVQEVFYRSIFQK